MEAPGTTALGPDVGWTGGVSRSSVYRRDLLIDPLSLPRQCAMLFYPPENESFFFGGTKREQYWTWEHQVW